MFYLKNVTNSLSNISNFSDSLNSDSNNISQMSPSSSNMFGNTHGVIIDTREVTSHSKRPGEVSASENTVLAENRWSLDNVLQRPFLVQSLDWTVSQPALTILQSWNVPLDLLVTNNVDYPFRMFHYWNGKIQLHLQVTGTPFHQGTCILVYLPCVPLGSRATEILANPCSLTVNQHIMVHANTSTSACLSIPFINPAEYIDLYSDSGSSDGVAGKTLGSVHLLVFNPLQAATSSTTQLNVSLFARFIDNNFKVPRRTAEITLFSTPAPFPSVGSSRVFKAQSLGSIVQKALPKNIVADSIDALVGVVGLDAPTDPNHASSMKMISTQHLNNSVGVQNLDKFTLDPSVMQQIVPRTFGVDVNEASFQYLKSKYSFLGSFSYTSSNIPGSVVASIPLTPICVPLYTDQVSYVPLLEYISLPYAYWKGGLKYKIQAICTSAHVTKLFCSVSYNNLTTTPPVSLPSLTSQYGIVFDVAQGSNEIEFTVPYVSSAPYKSMCNTYRYINASMHMGQLDFVVLNRLASSNNVADNITFNVFIAGADDYEVSGFSYGNTSAIPITPLPAPPVRTFKAQSLSQPLAPMSLPTTDTEFTSPNDAVVSPAETLHNRPIRNDVDVEVCSALKKYQYNRSVDFVVNSYALVPVPVVKSVYIHEFFKGALTASIPLSPGVYTRGLHAWYSSMFRLFRGPLRFKAIVQNVPVNYAINTYYIPPLGNADVTPIDLNVFLATMSEGYAINSSTTINHLMVGVLNGMQKTLEFEVPFQSIYNSVIPDVSFGSSNNFPKTEQNLGMLLFVAMPLSSSASLTTDLQIRCDVHMAFGDESKFGTLYRIPPVVGGNEVGTAPLQSPGPDRWTTYAATPAYNTLSTIPT